MADSDEESADICILPPEDGRLSETEDINEDNLLAEEPGDVSGVLEVFSAQDNEGTNIGSSETETGTAAVVGTKRKSRGRNQQTAEQSEKESPT